jgi:hypothetical protein
MKYLLNTVLTVSTIMLASCTCYKKSTGIIIAKMDGMELISNKEKNIYLRYPGDYKFHDLKKRQTLNWNDAFIKSIAWDKHRKELLYAGHTFVEPYCSSIGMLYRNANAAEIEKGIAIRLRQELKAQNLFTTEERIGLFNYVVLSYDLKDEQLDVSARYREYYGNEEGDVLRIVFWSMESSNDWAVAKYEAEAMLERRLLTAP